ncbi:MAG: MerR family transcriptional regulator [Spirochaetes bacterium]|nr:MerR family transcriptional regulator [Spirochaetota bacterium]MBU0956589.1 MerR family transcriptional regulator [Spirochaetota bacterium]
MDSRHTFRIGELARRFGITTRTIRYYEELGLLTPENRDQGSSLAHRVYGEKNVIRLKRIQQLKDYGLTLAEIHELFELARKDRSGNSVRSSLAEKYRSKLEEARRRRERLDNYIEDLTWHLEQLDKVDDFYECPGRACETCSWAERCDMRLNLTPEGK